MGWTIKNGSQIAPGEPTDQGRDTLLPKLLSGGIRVKSVEKFIGRAV